MATTASETGRDRILLVEDNEHNREILKDYLEGCCGWKVLALAEGSHFMTAMQQFEPHLVLLDLKLPDINGYQLLEQAQQHWQHIPVFVVSAFAFQADQQRALSLGAKRYFVKPTSLVQLRQAIAEELGSFLPGWPPLSCRVGEIHHT